MGFELWEFEPRAGSPGLSLRGVGAAVLEFDAGHVHCIVQPRCGLGEEPSSSQLMLTPSSNSNSKMTSTAIRI